VAQPGFHANGRSSLLETTSDATTALSAADNSPIGIILASGELFRVSYVNSAFRELAGTDDRSLVDLPFVAAFPRLSRLLPQLEHLARSEDPAAKINTLTSLSGRRDDLLQLTAWQAQNPVRETSSDETKAFMILLQRPLERRQKYQRRVKMDAGLREVNKLLILGALREQELTDRAEAASSAKSAFLTMMSHELRTPLNAIIGYASLLDDGISGPVVEQQHAHLVRLKRNAKHLLTLIDEILSLARRDAVFQSSAAECLDAEGLMDEVIALTMPLAESKQLGLSFDPVTPPFVVETNHQKLLQILVNLVGNAIKFTDRGQVLLSATSNGKIARFTVTDTGSGIAQENLERIFDAFWQVDQGHTRRAGGTGLGLKLSREMAQLLGGDLEVVSALGQGSAFTVWLPLRKAETL